MTIASLLLALITATQGPSSSSTSDPVMLDFQATWCGPCRQVRPAVDQLIREGYPVKPIDFDTAPELAARYRVRGIPTFIVIDAAGRELDRLSGPHPAADLKRFYHAAITKARPPASSESPEGRREAPRAGPGAASGFRARAGDEDEADDANANATENAGRDDAHGRPEPDSEQPEPVPVNPYPWETVVRIRVEGNHAIGFGSGTIVSSTPEESLILTCAHIFKLEGSRPAPPKQFPRTIMIDLFDGKLRGTRPAQVHYLESVRGEAIDYDFTRDVGLIRIRPGRRLPASRVVPAHWEPKSKPRPMKMLTVGCSEGHDATAWHTIIVNARMQGLSGNASYEAIECLTAPKQGRSGGGLFTTDGYLAGICNFAEPRGDHGLYATPRSIYALLDRNRLTALYAPVSQGSGTLVAEGRRSARTGPRLRSPAPNRRTPRSRSGLAASPVTATSCSHPPAWRGSLPP